MTIKWKVRNSPALGARRTVRRVLVFPKLLRDEWRWLGVEKVVQVWQLRSVPTKCGVISSDGWVDWDWAQ